MKPDKFFSELTGHFDKIEFSGLIKDDEILYEQLQSGLNSEHHHAQVMRLYFLAVDPEKNISYFITQYSEGSYLYMMEIEQGLWLFVLSSNKSFSKLHFFIKYLLAGSKLVFDQPDPEDSYKLDETDQKILSAKRIQDMLLPSLDRKLGKYPSYHLWYQPKDIIGGDFYWAQNTNEYDWIVIGDCTGHSIEGALASVSIMSLINEVFDPSLNPHLLIKSLHSSLNDMQEQDQHSGYGIGCEMIALKINKRHKIVEYSGTGLNLYVISGSNVRFYKTKKATLNPSSVVKNIKTSRLELKNGDALFTHSDGLTDQLDAEYRKLNNKKILQFLERENQPTPEKIKDFFFQFKQDEEQTDDVTAFYIEL